MGRRPTRRSDTAEPIYVDAATKERAIMRVISQNESITQVAEDVGLDRTTLSRWVKRARRQMFGKSDHGNGARPADETERAAEKKQASSGPDPAPEEEKPPPAMGTRTPPKTNGGPPATIRQRTTANLAMPREMTPTQAVQSAQAKLRMAPSRPEYREGEFWTRSDFVQLHTEVWDMLATTGILSLKEYLVDDRVGPKDRLQVLDMLLKIESHAAGHAGGVQIRDDAPLTAAEDLDDDELAAVIEMGKNEGAA